MTNLLLIESPGKIKKLGQILGSGWMVKASMGHIRELADDGEDALGFVLGDRQIECHYTPRNAQSRKVLADLRQAVKQADAVYIATDPDREGETIGWHLQQELRLKNPRRVVYSEITPQAVRAAIAQPRSLDQALIAAGRARDCLDKLVGYKGSKHVVWRLNIGAKSMGRVQSATLHLLCQREQEILAFQPQDYWSVWVEYAEGFKAFYRAAKSGQPTATPSAQTDAPADAPDDASEGQGAANSSKPESDRVTTQAEADRLVAIAQSHPHQVISVTGKISHQAPPPPFITSSLQQAAGAKLRFSPDKTMQVAQALYEAGLITYMRTDSVMLAAPFCDAVRRYLEEHDPSNVPAKATRHRAVKGAQEAHEAIRPTEITRVPEDLAIAPDQQQLYALIWNRAIASQCCPARLRKTRIITQSGAVQWEARGQVVEFPGYTRYWHNLSADSQLPPVQPGQAVTLTRAQADAKQTQPPPRYTEPKLVQQMERQGIGRPSTYAPTIKTLKQRDYVQVTQGKLQPTALGLNLDGALAQLLPELIQPQFTAEMEAALDAIAQGKQDWQQYLTDWHRSYFAPALEKARQTLQTTPTRSRPQPTVQPSTEVSLAAASPTVSTAPTCQSSPSKSSPSQSSPSQSSASKSTTRPTSASIACPQCGAAMQKIPSKSPKLKANHFLRCSAPPCTAVMFWNPQKKQYELPYAQRTLDPNDLTDHPCPVCGAFLEQYHYTKDGLEKVMLRCSIPEHRRGKCQEVAYFAGRDGFWSPKFGTIQVDTLPTGDRGTPNPRRRKPSR